jgi:peptide/nickel transport system substrate-binding protein
MVLTLSMIAMIPITPATSAREEELWATGYWNTGQINTFIGEVVFPNWFYYEVLFDMNYQTNTLIPIIGNTMVWEDSGATIKIELRSEAKWATASAAGAQITVDDVMFTYQLRLNSKLATPKIASFEKVSDTVMKVHLQSNSTNSRDVWYTFIGNEPILPKSVWSVINSTYHSILGSTHFLDAANWLPEWSVFSGPWYPTYIGPGNTILKSTRNDNWWGYSVFGITKENLPKTIGHKSYPSNFGQNVGLQTGELDLFSGYYAQIWNLLQDKSTGSLGPYITTYTDGAAPYYFGGGSMIQLCPNWAIYPMNQLWFRQALAYAIDYDAMSTVCASGYLNPVKPGWLDPAVPSMKLVYADQSAEYPVTYDPDKSIDILKANCYSKDGDWYTNDGPATATDADANHTGINVKVGGYNLMVPQGWSDTVMQATVLADQLSLIGVGVTVDQKDFGGAYVPNMEARNFQLAVYGIGTHAINAVQFFFADQIGTFKSWTSHVNASGWYGSDAADYITQYNKFQKSLPGSADEKDSAAEMQKILAKTLESIPIAINGYWYTVSRKNWMNWPTASNAWMQPVAEFSSYAYGAMEWMLVNLKKSTFTRTSVRP